MGGGSLLQRLKKSRRRQAAGKALPLAYVASPWYNPIIKTPPTGKGGLCVRDRWLLFVFFLITGAVFLLSPLDYVLTKKGLLENQNVGNVIQVEKHYDEDSFAADFLNRAEQVKRDIRDVYTPVFCPSSPPPRSPNRSSTGPWTAFCCSGGTPR